ncbi:MAG: hypothetical protein R8M38_05540 [Mariprofundaceae bacterium]
MMTRVTEFLNLYNKLDERMRFLLNVDRNISHARLLEMLSERDEVFRKFHSKLQAFRALRNSLVHMSYEGDGLEPIAEPYENVLNEYRMVVNYLINPPTALESIATTDVFSVGWGTKLLSGLNFLDESGYDTLPIIESGCIVGMYTQSCFQRDTLEKMKSGIPFTLDSLAVFHDINFACQFSTDDPNNVNNTIPAIRFADKSVTIESIENIFKSEARSGIFIIAVCITPLGTAFEPLLGLITPHNLPSANGFSEFILDRKN